MSFQPLLSSSPVLPCKNHCVLQPKGVLEPLGELKPGWWEGRVQCPDL